MLCRINPVYIIILLLQLLLQFNSDYLVNLIIRFFQVFLFFLQQASESVPSAAGGTWGVHTTYGESKILYLRQWICYSESINFVV